ncbi:hypothetical protein KSD_54010 [Ktedonobacter sp. SOSP1-85]|uniref:Acg family FMN-binding oxidoreductase n=1 Tax=Ktedonobacter sp. SOSP1-85 TaxID=2778367 RepID=UPI001915AB25|nr:hypothetical protein [Ktedonobacter sp. SOSP1-85]GHO77630.1 hypothetical protein KSD_54010 [Ktedonobacter sp. SOSP1-85]
MDTSDTSAAPTMQEGAFPREGSIAEKLQFILHYAALAPSEYNIQPWLFQVHNKTLEVYADLKRRLPIADPQGREVLISCGAACMNIRVALRYFGLQETLTFLPDPQCANLVARMTVISSYEPNEEDRRLFHALPWRHTYRGEVSPKPIPRSSLDNFIKQAGQEGTWIRFVEGGLRQRLMEFILEGDRQQWAHKDFRAELAQWLRPASAPDGMPISAHPRGEGHPFWVRTLNLSHSEENKIQHALQQAPALAILGTFGDSSLDWLLAGEALERVLLTACAEGIQASFFNQPLEIPELRTRLQTLLGPSDYPQMIMRMGYTFSATPTPRRAMTDMVLTQEP